jgi:protoporphyrinogen oxidase
VRALRAAFLGHGHHAALAIPTVGLSELYVEGARDFLLSRGADVRCNADVVSVSVTHGIVQRVVLRNGDELNCTALILAVPAHKAATLLGPAIPDYVIPDLGSSPIVSVHLWFRTDPMNHEVVGLVGRRVQWLFNRRKLLHQGGAGGHLSAVISAADEYVGLSNEELTRLALDDIRSAYPSTPMEPSHVLVIRERRATYRPRPVNEHLRPEQRTPLPNLALAGDWTATGFPATIEGAIVSAERSVAIVREWLYRARPGLSDT